MSPGPSGTSAVPALPNLALSELHSDFPVLSAVADAILTEAGGPERLQSVVGDLLRDCFDGVIKTAKTGRRFYRELEKTEKTHIGTCVEIDLRNALELERGHRLDLKVAGRDVDVKFTAGNAWMIPREAVDQICLLIAADDAAATFSIGLILARLAYLRKPNQDQKRSPSAHGREQIWWLVKDAQYPPNFWQTISPIVVDAIVSGRSANDRMVSLFRSVRRRVITRKTIEDVAGAGHKDFMRRIRADGKTGTRNILANEGILLLSGSSKRHQRFIKKTSLPMPAKGQFISHRVRPHERSWARDAGFRIE